MPLQDAASVTGIERCPAHVDRNNTPHRTEKDPTLSHTRDTPDSPARLVGVYNADGGIIGELTYVLGKIRGVTHCGLCDITHGRSPFPRRDWTDALGSLPLPMETVHLNEMDTPTARAAGGTSPVVVYLDGENDRILMDPVDLDACGGRVDDFLALVTTRLAEIP